MKARTIKVSLVFLFSTILTLFFCLSALSQAKEKSTLELVKEKGVLKAGLRKNQVPFSYVDEKGEIVGFEVDMCKYIADKLGVKLEKVAVSSATRIPLLEMGRIDLIAATMTHYRKREEKVDFSIGYYFSPNKVLVKKGSPIKSFKDLSGKRVGTAIGAGTLKALPEKAPGVKMTTYENHPDGFLSLKRGLVHAIATDYIVLAGFVARSDDADNYRFLPEPYSGGEFGIGIRENDSDWRDFIDMTLQDMWLDGTWEKIFNKWLGPGTKYNMTSEELGWKMVLWSF